MRYYTLRSSGYQFVFVASITGAVLLFVATVISYVYDSIPGAGAIGDIWRLLVPIPTSGIAATAFLMGATLWFPLNVLGERFPMLSNGAAVDRAILSKQDPLELLLRRALGSGRLISVTTKNNKVYVGKLHINYNPAYPRESITMLLSRSGYRKETTKNLVLDTDYDKTHQEVREKLADEVKGELRKALEPEPSADDDRLISVARANMTRRGLNTDPYEIVLPITEVQSVNIFDLAIYDEFFANHSDEDPRQ